MKSNLLQDSPEITSIISSKLLMKSFRIVSKNLLFLISLKKPETGFISTWLKAEPTKLKKHKQIKPKKCLKDLNSQLSLLLLYKISTFGKRSLTQNIELRNRKIRKKLK